MELTPREKDKLLLFTAALVAERRKARGLEAQLPGSGGADLRRDPRRRARRPHRRRAHEFGTTILARADVMDGVPEMIPEVQVEATFPDGTKLVTVHHPLSE